MFTTVLAREQDYGRGKLKTLNYAPGPLDTDMQTSLRESETLHPTTKEWSIEAFRGEQLVKPQASAATCWQILEKDEYRNGAHVDFFDCLTTQDKVQN